MNSAAAIQGYLYTDGGGNFGLLHSGGGWAVQISPGVNTVTFAGTTNHAAINATSVDVSGHVDATGYDVDAADGAGLRVWNSSAYSHYMAPIAHSGRITGETTSDYNQYCTMGSGTNRGYVWITDAVKLFAINPDGVRSTPNLMVTGYVSSTGSEPSPAALESVLSSNFLHIDGKEVIDGSDTWLRLNQNNEFTAGIYTPYAMRVHRNITANANTVGDGATTLTGILSLTLADTGTINMPGTGAGKLGATTTVGAMRSSNGTQWADIGCRNSSYCHIDTNASSGCYSYDDITVVGTADLKKASHGNYLYHASTSYDNDQNGQITFGTGSATGGTTGDIHFKYT